MQFIKTNGIVLNVADERSRPGEEPDAVLVFSNSLGTDFRIWDGAIAALKETIPANLRFIRYDKRGHGLSDTGTAPYRIGDHVDDLAGLLDALNVSKAIIVGLSVGGMIAQGLAASRPDLVSAIVLSNTAHRIGTADMWEDRINAIRKGGIEALEDAILERWFSTRFRETEATAFRAYRNMLVRTTVDGYAGTCAAIRDADLTETTSALDLPALLVGGSNDGSTPPDLMRTTHELIKGSRFEVIDGPGHLPCIETPEVFAGLVSDFLKENDLV